MNYIKTTLLLAALTSIFVLIGGWIGGQKGALVALLVALAGALRKLHEAAARTPLSVGTPATASLFIINPFSSGGLTRMFSTHPPVEERIRRLELLARGL